MAKISISVPDELLSYLDQKVRNRSQLITALLEEWRQEEELMTLLQSCQGREGEDKKDLPNCEGLNETLFDWEAFQI